MRLRMLWGVALSLVVLSAGCNAILANDFHEYPSGVDATASDGAPPDANAGDSARAFDATTEGVAADGSQTGEAGLDATNRSADAVAEGMASPFDAADAGTPSVCVAGGACAPNECQTGTWACTDAGRVCATTLATDGTACGGTGGDAGAHVCRAGQCVACNAGGDCSDPMQPCIKKSYDCSSGTAICKGTGNATDGVGCGTGLYCATGVCAACKVGAACPAPANPCHVGKITACTSGVATCTDQMTPAAAGTSCAIAGGASGLCDASGTCCTGVTPDVCTGSCVNRATDDNNCGTCGHKCTGTGGGTFHCNGGTCKCASCSTGFVCGGSNTCVCATGTNCSGVCVDTMSNNSHCGSCTTSCTGVKTCVSGTCQCPSGTTPCGAGCANLQTDNANCGSCGQTCAGQTLGCGGGRCVVILSATEANPQGIVVDNATSNIFWLNAGDSTTNNFGSINKVPKDGSTGKTLVGTLPTQFGQYQDLAVSGSNVFVPDFNGVAVLAGSVRGSTFPILYSDIGGPSGIAVDSASVYWTSYNSVFVLGAKQDGTPSSKNVLATPAGLPGRCATDGQNVYWVEAGGAANVSGVSVNPGGTPFNVATNQNNPIAIAVDATNVYWSAGGSILQAHKDGTSKTPTAIAFNQSGAQYIAVDSQFVYWVSGGTAVVKTPIGGGAVTTLASGLSGGVGIAVDGTSVYWTEVTSGSVKKVTPK